MDKRYQVFVSSTYADLKDERRTVIQALMEMDCIPAGMELFPAADEEQFQFIKRVIDDCDYYILIIGGRYGSTTPEGLSYTEKEYDYARGLKMKVLAFIRENPEELPFKNSETEPNLRLRLDAFREKAKTNTIVKMWKDAKELPGLVALSLSKTIKSHPAIGWVRANQLASLEALTDLNRLRESNSELLSRNNELEKKLAEGTPALADIAGLDDSIVMSGSHRRINWSSMSEWQFSATCGEIFAKIAPYALENPSDGVMKTYFTSSMREFYEKRVNNTRDYTNWSVQDQDYQTVKVQLMALDLVDIRMVPTTNGGSALFWFLTPYGRKMLIQLRTVRKNQETE
jgi:hypothetical protein